MNTKKIGNQGEALVSSVLSQFPSSNFRLFNNVMFRTKGGTTQIDHLLVSDRGIFVIETKVRKGWIVGQSDWKYWTQNLYYRGVLKNSYKFYSPYLQNRGHLKSVMETLQTRSICGVVCFVGDSLNLTYVNCESVTHIKYLSQLVWSVYYSAPQADYNFYEMCRKVSEMNIQSAYFDRKHVQYVKDLTHRG